MEMFDAFKLIAGRVNDPFLRREALKSLQTIGAAAQQMRLQWLLPRALESGSFSSTERAEMIALLEPISTRRDESIHFRVSPAERGELEQRAQEMGVSVSEYVRQSLFGDEK